MPSLKDCNILDKCSKECLALWAAHWARVPDSSRPVSRGCCTGSRALDEEAGKLCT